MATAAQYAKSFSHTSKFKNRHINRCWRCGRARAYMRAFQLCRICFRELATRGDIPGIRKASW